MSGHKKLSGQMGPAPTGVGAVKTRGVTEEAQLAIAPGVWAVQEEAMEKWWSSSTCTTGLFRDTHDPWL